MWRLVGIQGAYKGHFFSLSESTIVIGKSQDCNIKLGEDEGVAETQGEMVLCNGNYVFRDLDTRCKTIVNGKTVAGMQPLSPGDILQIGESTFRIEDSQTVTPVVAFRTNEQRSTANRCTASPVELPYRASWTTPLVISVLAVIFVLGLAVPRYKAIKANQARYEAASKMALDATSAIRAISSATAVGVNEQEYSRKVIDAQAKIDTYLAEYGETEFSGYGAQLSAAIKPYALAASVWNYKISEDTYTIGPRNTLYNEVIEICPEAASETSKGGAFYRMEYSGINVLWIDTSIQLLWQKGRTRLDGLKFPTE